MAYPDPVVERPGRYLLSAALDSEPTAESPYPFDIPAVRAFVEPIEFGAVTVFVGENGSGKSTIVEGLAVATGFNAEGGGRNLRFETRSTHSDLWRDLTLRWRQRSAWGWFLRAETFYGMANHVTADGALAQKLPPLHDMSHGESFIALLEDRFAEKGFYLMDEPESALSFSGQLRLLRLMHEVVGEGGQFVIATHSPLLMSYPGAVLYECDDDGLRRVGFDDVSVVQLWKHFLGAPDRFLRPLLDD